MIRQRYRYIRPGYVPLSKVSRVDPPLDVHAMAESTNRKRLQKSNYAVPAKKRSIGNIYDKLKLTPFFGYHTYEEADMITNKYNLENLLDHYRVDHAANEKDEVLAQKLLENVFGDGFRCFPDQELKAGEVMYPNPVFIDSPVQRPDVTVVLALSSHSEKLGEAFGLGNIPVLLVECHSDESERDDSYEHTIIKALLGLIDQFRFLTHCCREASDLKLTGFVLPSSRESKCVTEIKLSWTNWTYVGVEKCLELEDVMTALREAKTRILNYTFNSPPIDEMSYLKLSQNDLCKIGQGVTQIPRSTTILATNGSEYFKIYPTKSNVILYLEIMQLKSGLPLKKFLLPSAVMDRIVTFPALPYPPLSIMDAKRCLRELVSGVVEALEEIHSEPYQIAHLDILLDNICFDGEGKPVLIDPDRICRTNVEAQYLERQYPGCVMYKPGDFSWNVDRLDWMQLGYMIADVLEDGNSPDYHTMSVGDEILRDNFVRTLIQDGKISKSDMEKSRVFTDKCHHEKLLDVLIKVNCTEMHSDVAM